jgi:hypothetical protein
VWSRRFDWFFKSRTPPELQRRADTLIRLIEKELEDENVSREQGLGSGAGVREQSGVLGAGGGFREQGLNSRRQGFKVWWAGVEG